MTDSQGSINLLWAHRIIDGLFQLGVRHFYISPGSRSTPLVVALADHPLAQHVVHFDERGTAFCALGCAKAQNKASAIIVTSGTAVGNLLPAIMEASNSRVPLIFLTADRPKELLDCGDNQTCDHIKLFSSYVRWQIDLPTPSASISEKYLLSSLSQAVYKAQENNPGPVHINCPFPKPLVPLQTPVSFQNLQLFPYEPTQTLSQIDSLQKWAAAFQKAKKGVIIVGSCPTGQKAEPIFDLAQKLKWPVLADPLSHARALGKTKGLIRYYDAILKTSSRGIEPDLIFDPKEGSSLKASKLDFEPDLILHLGDRLTSKALAQWLQKLNISDYFQVSNHPNRQDPNYLVTSRLCVDPSLFCEMISPLLEDKNDSSWMGSWEEASQKAYENLNIRGEGRSFRKTGKDQRKDAM